MSIKVLFENNRGFQFDKNPFVMDQLVSCWDFIMAEARNRWPMLRISPSYWQLFYKGNKSRRKSVSDFIRITKFSIILF